jgi:histidinol-phosphate aminotransferase
MQSSTLQDFGNKMVDYFKSNGGIIFPNPNAPTGIPLPLVEIEKLLQHNTQSVVVIDEAYVDFGTESAVRLINQYPNLLVTHTLSKARSLAGLRVGYALGHPDLIQALTRVKDSFNSYPIDRLASAGAIAAMQDDAYFQDTCAKVMNTRATLTNALINLGFTVLPSGANFIFAKHNVKTGLAITTALREQKIIVRHFAKPARIADYVRITIGDDEQNTVLMNAMTQIVRL